MNMSFTGGVLATAGAATTHATTVAMKFIIAGLLYSKAAITGGTTPVVDGNTGIAFLPIPADHIGCFIWGLNAAGAVSLYQGDILAVDGSTDIAETYPQPPGLPAGIAPFGYTVVQSDGTASDWTIGTSNWNATGITLGVHDIGSIPVRPLGA